MRSTSIVLALAATFSSVAAQSDIQSLLSGISSTCQQTLLSLATASDFSSCIHVSQLVPIITPLLQNTSPNASLIPALDQITSIECGQPGCSNATLTSAANTIISGCSTDLQKYGISNSTVKVIFRQYPLAREIVCLKTSAPFNGTAPIPSTSSVYNTTNGTFCSTSLLTDISSKFNTNISVAFLEKAYSAYQNGNLSSYASKFNASDLCQDCIFATVDLVGIVYPVIGNVTLGQLASGGMNSTSTRAGSNITIEQALDATCMSKGFTYATNGTLPDTIYLSAVNSTFPFALTAGNQTRPAQTQTTPIRRNVAAVKGRWVGQV